MNSSELAPGTMLSHGYRIIRVLGQGGFGITYLALDVNLDKEVAIKEFFPKMLCGRRENNSHVTVLTQINEELVEKLKAKFLKEARNIARLNHPNIIKIHAAFEQNDTAYYVMELIEGQSLSEYVREHGALSPEIAVDYIRKVGSALEYIHEKRINHLDVKPSNILLRRSNHEPILIDFGLSKQYDAEGGQTSTTPVGVSAGYAPMEQYSPGGVSTFSPETDVYALGATLYYLLTGMTPPTAFEVRKTGLPFASGFPPNLKTVITKAMSPDECDRYHTVADFIDSLSGKAQKIAPQQEQEETKMHMEEETRVVEKEIPVIEVVPEPEEALGEEDQPKTTKRLIFLAIILAILLIGSILYFATSRFSGYDKPTVSEDSIAIASTTIIGEEAIIETDEVEDSTSFTAPKDIDNEYPQEKSQPQQDEPNKQNFIATPETIEESLNLLINSNFSLQKRLNSIPNIFNKFFDDNAKIYIVGNSDIILDVENAEDFLRRIALSSRIKQIIIIGSETNDRITKLNIKEINN